MRDSIFLDIDMYSVSSWKGRMGSMLQLLMAQSKLHPIKIGDRSDTDSLPITMEQAYSLNEQWLEARSISFCSYAPEFFLNLYRHLMRPKNREPDHLIMGIELSFLNVEEHVESFLTLCKSLYGWGDMLYGYAAHPKDYKAQT